MPRNSSGTYTLPAGNPVVTGTTISSSWANVTLADLAASMTDSLSRTGQGSMTASLLLSDGTSGAPGLSWGNESTSGLYRAGAGDFRYSVASVDKLQIVTGGLRMIDGVLATPSHSFISDPDTGMWRGGANILNFSAGGVLTFGINANAAYAGDGTVALPGLGFSSDPDTGIYHRTVDTVSVSGGGVLAVDFSSSFGVRSFFGYWTDDDGAIGTPAYSFTSDQDTGFWRNAANDMRASAGGVNVCAFQTTGLNMGLPIFSARILGSDGTAPLPEYSFSADPNTGMYRVGTDTGALAAGGGTSAVWSTQGFATNQDGSTGNPGFYFNNDTNCGFYRIGADNFAATVGGSNCWEVNLGSNYVKFGINSSTELRISAVTAASASAGGVGALPATVAGYLDVTINGSIRTIPFYNP